MEVNFGTDVAEYSFDFDFAGVSQLSLISITVK